MQIHAQAYKRRGHLLVRPCLVSQIFTRALHVVKATSESTGR